MRRQTTQMMCLILVMLVISGNVLGQDTDTPRVGGNVIGTNFVTQSVGELMIEATATGTNNGIASFCVGELDMVVTNRPMTTEEESLCEENATDFAESRIGYVGVLPIVHTDNATLDCLSVPELDILLAPSQTGAILNWSDFTEANEATEATQDEQTISLHLPEMDSLSYQLLDEVVSGLGLRTDVETESDVVSAVAEDINALGFIPLNGEELVNVKVLNLFPSSGSSCVGATDESLFVGNYPLAQPLYAYTAQTEGATSLLNALLESFSDAESMVESHVLKATPQDIEVLNNIVSGAVDGRLFSSEVSEYQVSPTVSGNVSLAGSANLATIINSLNNSLTQSYPSLVVNATFSGLADAERQLCNGEVNMIVTSNGISDTLQQNCDAVDIELMDIEIGRQAVVLVGNAQDEGLQCLTTEQLLNAWGAHPEQAETWDQISADFPEKPITLFTDSYGSVNTSLLMIAVGASNTPTRPDLEVGRDSLYRAAATANVEGAMTLVNWEQYQDILENQQSNIQLVAVDAGNGCVLPSLETIQSGDYLVSRNTHLVINRASLQEEAVRSYLWMLFADDRATALSRQSFIAVDTFDLKNTREMLQNTFEEVMAAAVVATEEASETETLTATPTASN